MTMMLNSDDIARITGGKWLNLKGPIEFHGVRVNINLTEENDLFFTTTPSQWGAKIPNSEKNLAPIFDKDAAAAVISNADTATQTDKPLLLVKDTKKALTDVAFYVRDNKEMKRVVVTGAVGKTGFKNQLYRLLNQQTLAHAHLDSSNLDVPILCSMASAGADDSVEVVEVASATAGVGVRRSNLVKPDVCVITEIGFEHLDTGGSFEKIVKNKAAIVDGLKQDGLCVLNANSKNYDLIREAIYQRKFVNIKTYGKRPNDDARLISAAFDAENLLWNVDADIEGEKLEYCVPLLGEHVPVSSLAPLLVMKHLGYNIKKAAADFRDMASYETMGTYSEVVCKDKKFEVYDHSQRGSVLSYSSAMLDLNRMPSRRGGRKIAILGNMLFIGKESKGAHADLAQMINKIDIDKLYIVGKDAECMIPSIMNKSIPVTYADNYEEIQDSVLGDIQDGDLIFIKGPVKVYLKKLAQKIYTLGNKCEIR